MFDGKLEAAQHQPQGTKIGRHGRVTDEVFAPELGHSVPLWRRKQQALDDLIPPLYRCQTTDIDVGPADYKS